MSTVIDVEENKWGNLVRGLVKGMAVISNVIILAVLFFVIAEIVCRAAFGRSIKGVVEISGLLMVPMYFLGVAYVQLRKEHIKVDSFLARLPPRFAGLHSMLTSIIILMLFSVIGYYGARMAIQSYQTGEFEFTISFWPIWAIRAFVPLGALLMGLLVVTEVVEQARILVRRFH